MFIYVFKSGVIQQHENPPTESDRVSMFHGDLRVLCVDRITGLLTELVDDGTRAPLNTCRLALDLATASHSHSPVIENTGRWRVEVTEEIVSRSGYYVAGMTDSKHAAQAARGLLLGGVTPIIPAQDSVLNREFCVYPVGRTVKDKDCEVFSESQLMEEEEGEDA